MRAPRRGTVRQNGITGLSSYTQDDRVKWFAGHDLIKTGKYDCVFERPLSADAQHE